MKKVLLPLGAVVVCIGYVVGVVTAIVWAGMSVFEEDDHVTAYAGDELGDFDDWDDEWERYF